MTEEELLELLDSAITDVCKVNENYSAELFDDKVDEIREEYVNKLKELWAKIDLSAD